MLDLGCGRLGIQDLAFLGSNAGQLFALWRYERVAANDGMLPVPSLNDGETVNDYRRIDNITGSAWRSFRAAYGRALTKDDIYFYVYGLLHSADYRETYASGLKKAAENPVGHRSVAVRRGWPPTLRAAPRLRAG